MKYFSESENPKIIHRQEKKTDQAWRQRCPEITIKPFKTKAEFRPFQLKQMITDGKHLFVAEQGRKAEVFVIDAETLDVLHKLDVTLENIAEVKPALVRIETDGNFLVAFARFTIRYNNNFTFDSLFSAWNYDIPILPYYFTLK